jgi:hypothetical protein
LKRGSSSFEKRFGKSTLSRPPFSDLKPLHNHSYHSKNAAEEENRDDHKSTQKRQNTRQKKWKQTML